MMAEQMRVTYANAAKILAHFGATLDHVVEETLYVLDVDEAFAVAGKVRKEAYAKAPPQCASNLIGVSRLAFPPRSPTGGDPGQSREKVRVVWPQHRFAGSTDR